MENAALEKTVLEKNRVLEENCYFPYQENSIKCFEENEEEEEEEEGEMMMDLRQERINERRKRGKKHSVSANVGERSGSVSVSGSGSNSVILAEPSSESVSMVSYNICYSCYYCY